jgi:hypothetical protein
MMLHGGSEGVICGQHRAARSQALIMGMADQKAGHIGNQVPWSRFHASPGPALGLAMSDG